MLSKLNLQRLARSHIQLCPINDFSTLAETSEVKFVDLFDEEFVSNCSKFASINDLFDASGLTVESVEDFAGIPNDVWEAFIVSNTTFDSCLGMRQAALKFYTKKKLFSGIK